MASSNLINLSNAYFDAINEPNSQFFSLFPDLFLARYFKPTEFESVVYEPVICLILQGTKETTIKKQPIEIGSGQSILISHDLTISSRITKASKESPYIALVMKIDLNILRSLHESTESFSTTQGKARSFELGGIDVRISEALERYLKLINNPQDVKILRPLIVKEIHYRLLTGSQGTMLRHLMWRNSQTSNIYRAIKVIRENFKQPIVISEIAKHAGMGVTSFHTHFKSVTGTTPLQYQKALRMIEAKQMLIAGHHSVSSAAFEVGYESPTQFSREYKREFGHSPADDLTSCDNFDLLTFRVGQ
jgi:AraC-like DNA-binding protein